MNSIYLAFFKNKNGKISDEMVSFFKKMNLVINGQQYFGVLILIFHTFIIKILSI